MQFNAGSGGTWTGATVERVGVGNPPSGFAAPTAHAVTVTDAAPTFNAVTVRDPVVSAVSVDGFYVSGAATQQNPPVITNAVITGMTGSGVVANAGARVDVVRGTFQGNGGPAVVAGGTNSAVYLVPASGTGGFVGPQITGNPGGGVAASGTGAAVRFGTANAATPGNGFATVTDNNPGRGLSASGGAAVYAGTGTLTSATYQRNRIFNNWRASPTGNALATGTGSRVFARCNWWSTTETYPYRTGAASGGLVDVSANLTGDPSQNPSCVTYNPPGRPGGGSAWTTAGTAARGNEASALDRLAEAFVAPTASEAIGLLAALVADEPETEAAAAALGEAGAVASQTGSPATATALLTTTTLSAYGPLRVASWQALVASRRANGDRAGALAAADALAGEGGTAVVQAEVARVYLHGEAGDSTAAYAALAAVEALAPGSVELDLARAFLGLGDASTGGRTAATAAAGPVDAAKVPAAVDVVSLAVGPNPTTGAAVVTVTLAAASDATVTVYDLLGRAVATPLAGTLTPGAHRADLDAARLAPGVYVVRVVVNTAAGAVVQSARLTVAR